MLIQVGTYKGSVSPNGNLTKGVSFIQPWGDFVVGFPVYGEPWVFDNISRRLLDKRLGSCDTNPSRLVQTTPMMLYYRCTQHSLICRLDRNLNQVESVDCHTKVQITPNWCVHEFINSGRIASDLNSRGMMKWSYYHRVTKIGSSTSIAKCFK